MENNKINNQINQLPDGWEVKKLGDVGKVITGKTPSKNNPEHWGEVLDFITPTFYNGSKRLGSSDRRLSKLGFEAFTKYIIPKNNVMVTCIGSDMGKIAINFNDCVTNQQINSIIINKKSDVNFIYYFLSFIKPQLKNIAFGGTTMPIINKSTFENLQIHLPPLDEQKKIAALLSSLDDKIELNQQINKKLEEMAQAIFRQWFIDFNFPDENGNPYRDSGGPMIDSELGQIPAGWSVGKLCDICSYIASGGTPSTKERSYYFGNINWFTTKELNDGFVFESDKTISDSGLLNSSAKKFQKHSVVVAMYGATSGKLAILSNEATFNQATCGMITDENKSSTWFLYLWLLNNREHLVSLSNGAAQQNLNVGQIKNYPILLIDCSLNTKFRDFAESIFLQIERNSQEIIKLQNSRDILLPKLMSGEIRL